MAFQPVNTSLEPDYSRNGEERDPTTPRPNTAPSLHPQPLNQMDSVTPTRTTFASGTLADQRPLPAQPFPAAISMPETTQEKGSLHRGDSQYSSKSRDSEDVDMDNSEDGGEEGSDEESVNADGTRSKKKKSQRFYCTDYPPCTLSFTRSEHLARHIRKHTGERPFTCHCGRKFSRLDNLRQHAQTVHVNEEIPTDSLAATGTRFQRQVRTERVRPPGSRSRAATAGSQTPGRGHHRNSLSASSIGSIGSFRDERRRPAPLVMAGSNQRLSGEFRADSPNQYYRPHSPGGFSTPTSATFSTGQSSPRWGSAMPSPISSHSRTQSIYNGHRTPGRRLSVPGPSSGNPFQSPHGQSYGPPPLSSGLPPYSPSGSSMLTSPTSSTTGSIFARRESINAADEAWRRRTWHPETHSNFTSRLQNVTSANTYYSDQRPQVPVVPSNAPPLDTSKQLPGIESFDARPRTPVRRQPSPMMIDTPARLPPAGYQERPSSQHWDMGINRNFNRLDIAQTQPTDAASSWATEANRAVQAQAEQARAQPPQIVRFEESHYSARAQQHQSAPPVTPKEAKRNAWYHGPLTPVALHNPPIDPQIQRTSEDSSSSEGVPGTPSSATVQEYNPGIVHSNGYVENRHVMPVPESRILSSNAPNGYYPAPPNTEQGYTYAHGQPPPQQAQQHQLPKDAHSDMSAFQVLVDVAANEGKAAATTAY